MRARARWRRKEATEAAYNTFPHLAPRLATRSHSVCCRELGAAFAGGDGAAHLLNNGCCLPHLRRAVFYQTFLVNGPLRLWNVPADLGLFAYCMSPSPHAHWRMSISFLA
jgi:hypothetical protein